MKNSNYILPNALTLLNLLCGSAAIIFLFESPHEQPYAPVLLLVLAAVFDVFDGLTAKLLHATSEFGKQLDSLADLISFGLAPAVMMYHLLILSFVYQSDTADFLIETASVGERLVLYSSLLILVFAALRLARFNVTTHIGSDFTGLPVPASALFIVSIWLAFHITEKESLRSFLLTPVVLFSLIALLSFLMVSKIKMLSLKFEGVSFSKNSWRYLLLIGAVILYIIFGISSLAYIMILYLLLSFSRNIIDSKRSSG
jgi:CDP-diacylglycerol--serine O-phosphatidyltransferase